MRRQPLPEKLYQGFLGTRLMHAIMRRRANELLEKSRLHRHLPLDGFCLDLGCGSGHITEAVAARAASRHCISLDPIWLPSRRMRQRLAAFGARFVKAAGTALPFRDATLAGVWAAFVLHHMKADEQIALLREVARVLRPAGTFVLIEDTPDSETEAALTLRADQRINFEGPSAPHCYRSPAEWRSELDRQGFAVLEEIGFAGLFPQVTGRPVQHRAYVCLR